MSASREKKMRKVSAAQPAGQNEPKQKSASKVLKRILGVAAGIAAVALICVSLLFGSSYFHRNATAVSVGEYSISPAELNYYFKDAYYALAQEYVDYGEYASYLAYMTDTIMEEAKESVRDAYSLYHAAVQEGYTLNEEEIAMLDEEIDSIEVTADTFGVSGDRFLEVSYGKGCTVDNYRKYREVRTLVTRYVQDFADSVEITEEEKQAYYAEHKDDLDTVSYRQFFLPTAEGSTLEDTHALAETILKEAVADPTVMDKYAREYATEEGLSHLAAENPTKLNSVNKVAATAGTGDWLFDAERKSGDTQYFDNEAGTGCYLIYFISRNTGDYSMVNVRHILLKVADFTDTEAANEAKTTAQEILAEYLAGDKTEEAFALLATSLSEDNADEGGLYENVYKGQMVTAFNDWCFDESRKPGDTGIVETEYGYHVMYFVGEGDSYQSALLQSSLLDIEYAAWISGLKEGMNLKEVEFGMQFVNTTIQTSTTEA